MSFKPAARSAAPSHLTRHAPCLREDGEGFEPSASFLALVFKTNTISLSVIHPYGPGTPYGVPRLIGAARLAPPSYAALRALFS